MLLDYKRLGFVLIITVIRLRADDIETKCVPFPTKRSAEDKPLLRNPSQLSQSFWELIRDLNWLFPQFKGCQNYLQGLGKHRFLGPISRFWSLRFCIYVLSDTGQDNTFWKTLI